jgi:hypothetical protein
VGKTVGRSMERQGWRWWVDQGGCLDPAATGPYGESRAEKRRRQRGGQTEDWLSHRCKHGEEHRRARVRVHP